MINFAFHLVQLNCVVVAVINNISSLALKYAKRAKQNRRFYQLHDAKTQVPIKIDLPSNYAAV